MPKCFFLFLNNFFLFKQCHKQCVQMPAPGVGKIYNCIGIPSSLVLIVIVKI